MPALPPWCRYADRGLSAPSRNSFHTAKDAKSTKGKGFRTCEKASTSRFANPRAVFGHSSTP